MPPRFIEPEECGGDILQKLMGLDSHIDITDEDIDMIMRNRRIDRHMCRKTKDIDPMRAEIPAWRGPEEKHSKTKHKCARGRKYQDRREADKIIRIPIVLSSGDKHTCVNLCIV